MWNAPITIRPERKVDARRDVAETAPTSPTAPVRGDRALEGRAAAREAGGQKRERDEDRPLAVREPRRGRRRIGTIIDDYA